ncbi:hypothetical protein FRC08_005655 [Ceratobasidium sp. 394]|nr:hypothetical protein FRC08_005655 [Ceratobasidium sp. 394]
MEAFEGERPWVYMDEQGVEVFGIIHILHPHSDSGQVATTGANSKGRSQGRY